MEAYDSALARKLAKFLRLGPLELEALAQLEANHRPVAAGTELVRERQIEHHAYILEAGWACSYKLLPDGGRQVIDFPIPGDVIGLRSLLLRTADHSFAALTDVTVAEISAPQLTDASSGCRGWRQPFSGAPPATRRWWSSIWSTSADAAPWCARRISWSSWGCGWSWRAWVQPTGYACPLSQYMLADALGLTAIHLNRVLRQLREQGLVTFRDGQVTFHDLARLSQLADHHSGYLDQANGERGL